MKLKRTLRNLRDACLAGMNWKQIRLPPLRRDPAPSHYLTVATSIKNEARNLEEWIDFHHRLGVDRFILYDNGSTDETREVLEPYCRSGLVTLIPWNNFSVWLNSQRAAYAHAISNFGVGTFWMGFFDIDEFVFPVSARSLVDVLEPREHLPVLGVAGINFGTNGHQRRPAGGVLRSYTKSVPMDRQREWPEVLLNTKCFVQADRIESIVSLHWFKIRGDDALIYNEHGEPVFTRPRAEPEKISADVIRYNHYFTRSREEFRRKAAGTDARGPRYGSYSRSKQSMFDAIERLAVEDHSIERLLTTAPASESPSSPRRERLVTSFNRQPAPLPAWQATPFAAELDATAVKERIVAALRLT